MDDINGWHLKNSTDLSLSCDKSITGAVQFLCSLYAIMGVHTVGCYKIQSVWNNVQKFKYELN